MNKLNNNTKVFLFTGAVTIGAAIFWDLTFLQSFITFLELFFLFYFLARVGYRFVYLELLALIANTQWLFAPMIAQRLEVEMDVSFETYFAYALPATLCYLTGLTLPLWNQQKLDVQMGYIFNQISINSKDKHLWGIVLIVIGLPFWLFQTLAPASLNYIFSLLAHIILVGICILMFTNYRWKWLWIGLGLTVLVSTTFLNGMIGSVILWIFIIGIIYTSRNPIRIPYLIKLTSLMAFLWILLVLQAAKTVYRINTWEIKKSEVSSRVSREMKKDPALFYKLIKERILDPKMLTDKTGAMALVGRMNQGYLTSHAMRYVPRRREFGKGEVTLLNSAIAFIPRIFWESKPVVGQAEYYKKYTGIRLTKYTSSTIGPLGDAYVDYGKWGMVFLGFFGWMIGRLYQYWINRSMREPTFMLWFMVIFLGTITVTEVSVAGYVNGILKFIIFIFILRFLLRLFLKIKV